MSQPIPGSNNRFVGDPSPPASPEKNQTSKDNVESPANNTAPALEFEKRPNHITLTPPHSSDGPRSHINQEEHSQASSSEPRRPRGGRKQSQTQRPLQHIESVSIIELPPRNEPPPEDEEQDDYDWEDGVEALLAPPDTMEDHKPPDTTEDHDVDYDADALKNARLRGSQRKKAQPPGFTSPTGISVMNLERPRGGGRKPPISVSVERPEEKCKTCQAKSKQKNRKKAAHAEESNEGSEGEESEEEKRKPVQIRLELNLDLEILLKAKIKGDITITFLQ